MIVADLAVSFAFVEVDDGSVLEVLWHCLVLPDELKQLVKFSTRATPPSLKISGGMESEPGDLPLESS